MIDHAALASAIHAYLPLQRWFGAKDRGLREVVIEKVQQMTGDWPHMLSVPIEAVFDDDTFDRYHILIGLRPGGQPAVFLEGNADAVLGEFSTEAGMAYGYDALRDPELALTLFRQIAPMLDQPSHVRPVGAEQSNTSLIYDESYIFKVFRKLSEGRNLDVEVTKGLWSVGFQQVAEPLGEWSVADSDRGIIQRYLAGGAEGWALALTSLRDLFGDGGDPAEAGGDFAAEAERLGEMTAALHLALSSAFGTNRGDASGWAGAMQELLTRVDHPSLNKEAIRSGFQRIAAISDPGPSIRVHGDYHLGQVMRTDTGWFVLDFEGEPARPIEERRRPSSPLKDIAGMLRSLDYASRANASEANEVSLASSWATRNRQAFLDGYVAVAHKGGGLLPSSAEALQQLLWAFEMEKAVYEVAYEQSHRPEWVGIPLAAIEELLAHPE